MKGIQSNFKNLLRSPLSPYLALMLLVSAGQVGVSESKSWDNIFVALYTLASFLAPILFCKYRSLNIDLSIKRRVGWWVAGFIFLPVIYLILSHEFQAFQSLFKLDFPQVLILWALELFLISRKSLLYPLLNKLKFRPTVDNVLFIFIVAFSTFWALVFNSIDNPIENQPLNILIDLRRNAFRFTEFVAYFVQFFSLYFCIYTLYWINHRVLVNKVMARFGVFNYLWITIVFVLLSVPLMSQLMLLLPINTAEFTLLPSQNHDPFDDWNYRIGFLVMVFSLPLILAFKWQEQSKQVVELEKQQVQTELLWLQQQINPHFLFNTLNNLYSLTLTKSSQAPEMVLQLANLLRFVVYKGSEAKVSLKDELGYLVDYLDLQQLRVAHKCKFEVDFPQQPPALAITPLLLINFIENAFKHGVEPNDQSSELQVKLAIDGRTMRFSCRNSLPENYHSLNDGVGLSNVKRRLSLLYPEHILVTGVQDNYFNVELTMELAEDLKAKPETEQIA